MGSAVSRAGAVPGEESRALAASRRLAARGHPWPRFLPGHPDRALAASRRLAARGHPWPRFLPGHPDRALAAWRRLAARGHPWPRFLPGHPDRALAAWRRLAARGHPWPRFLPGHPDRALAAWRRLAARGHPWPRFLPGHPDRALAAWRRLAARGHPWPRFLPGHPDRALAAWRRLAHGDALRLNLRPLAHALQAIDYDGFARCESRLHHPQAVDDRTELHRPVLGLVARAYDQYVAHGLIGADRAVVDEDRLVLMRTEQPQARKQPRREQPITIVEQRAAADGAGGGIQGVVHEHHHALVRIAALVGEPHLHRVAAAMCPIARELGVLEIHLLIPVKAHVDRIERHQRREERLSIGHEIAAGDERAADAPGDGRGQAREVEIQRRGIERGLGSFHVRLPLLEPGGAGVELRLRDSMLREEL